MKRPPYIRSLWLVLALVGVMEMLHLAGCAYSFTGSSVPPHLKTVAIPIFDDQSGSGEQNLREKFTTQLINRFTRDNSLDIATKGNSDSILEGVIQSLRAEATTVTGGESVTRQRMTLAVKVTYTDLKLKKKLWEKQLSNWGEFEAGSGQAGRQAAIDAAIEKLTDDILRETVAGW